MLQTYTELPKAWNRFLIGYVLSSAMEIILSARQLGFSFELRPSKKDSYHIPKEWRNANQDLVAIEVLEDTDRMIDVLVHELGHVEFTPRDNLFKELMTKYGDLCNLVEDVRIEHLIRQKYGWTFSTWEHVEKGILEQVIENSPLVAWLYTKKVASSRGEEVPKEYVELFRTKVGEEELKKLEKAYKEAINIKTSQDMKDFLEKHLPGDKEEAIKAASVFLAAQGQGCPQGQGQAQGQGQGQKQAQKKGKASGGGSDLAKGEKEIQRIEEETKAFEKELKKALGLGKEAEEGVGQAEGSFSLKAGCGSGGIRFNEKYLQVKKNPQLEEYLRGLYKEESKVRPEDRGYSVNLGEYVNWIADGKRGKAKIFNYREESIQAPKVVFIVDTSGSMDAIGEEVRELLWAVVEMSKRELLEGKVVFTGDGDALAVSLPTNKPIWTVEFTGGTNGYDKALKHVDNTEEEFVIFVSDLMIDSRDTKFIQDLCKLKEGQVFFLYGGEGYDHYFEKARETFPEIPVKNLFFAVNVPLALQKLVQELGYRQHSSIRRI